jgi:hypothetical protein
MSMIRMTILRGRISGRGEFLRVKRHVPLETGLAVVLEVIEDGGGRNGDCDGGAHARGREQRGGERRARARPLARAEHGGGRECRLVKERVQRADEGGGRRPRGAKEDESRGSLLRVAAATARREEERGRAKAEK